MTEDPHIVRCAFASVFTIVRIYSFFNLCRKTPKTHGKFAKTVFVFLFWRSPEKNFEELFSFFWRALAPVSLVLGPWPRAFLSLASRGSVLGRAVLCLGLGFFCVLGLGLEPCVLDSTSDKKNCKLKAVNHPANYGDLQ